MKPRHFASAAKVFLPLLCLVTLCLISPSPVRGEGILPAGMKTYAAEPPFAAAGIKSNLLLMLDNSGSMYDLAYTTPSTYCLDESYQNGTTYSGYFDPSLFYRYDANRFVKVGGPLPTCSSGTGSCAASTSYLYLEMTVPAAPGGARTVTSFMASGNFLNWLSASKMDIQRKVLTGGKFIPNAGSTTTGALQAESRGCQGKRFIKTIKDIGVTFVVRGPTLKELGFTYDTSRGGESTIEVYGKVYPQATCLGAIEGWIEAIPFSQVTALIDACVDAANNRDGKIFSHAMGLCYDPASQTETNNKTLLALCKDKYTAELGPVYWPQQLSTVDGICGRNIKHLGGQNTGFIGLCVGMTISNVTPCLSSQITDYCNEVRSQSLTDPSTTATMAGGRTQIPSYILDAGVYSLGPPSGSFNARLSVDEQPVGLIQKFAGSINFGAMLFNANGAAGAECGAGRLPCTMHCANVPERECRSDADCGGTCAEGVDGGQLISYINDPSSPLGDHASGLIGKINSMKGSTWTPYAEAFYNAIGYYGHRKELRLSPSDFNPDKPDPAQNVCQRNNILMVSDGISTADSNATVQSLASLYAAGREAMTGRDGNIPPLEGSRSLDDLAWVAAHRDIRSFSTTAASTATPANPRDSITTHVIFTGVSNGDPGEADPAALMRRTAESGGGVFATASDPAVFNDRMLMVLRQVAHGTGSGTDVSIHSGGGNGALFLQQGYFPNKSFDGDTSASWIGEMQGLWYYIDPFIANSSGGGSTIREETVRDGMLKLSDDRAVRLGERKAIVFYDRNGDGNSDGNGAMEEISADAVQALWRAGKELWARNLESAPRSIFTPLLPGGTQERDSGLMRFSFANPDHSAVLQPYLRSATEAEAAKLIRYVQGYDFPGDNTMRSRTVKIGNIPASVVGSDTTHSYVSNPRDRGIGVWKLGDVISSTAKVQSATPLSSYDLPASAGYDDRSYRSYLGSEEYRNRGMIYLGANDGMLHAFRMGKLKPGTGTVTAVLESGSATPGEEAWAFIPRHVLPYLTYLKEPAYQHLYLMDGAVTLADVSIGDTVSGSCNAGSYWNCVKEDTVTMADPLDSGREILDPGKNTWRTVVIGSMGLGGASWGSGSCAGAADPAKSGAPCVPTPIPDSTDPSKSIGYSSYFALDVTDPARPSLLWEFSHPDLGYSTSGAAIVRVGDPTLNGRWFAVFGSGPTGPIKDQQFLGESNQKLRFFVVDLRSGKLIATIDSGIGNAFSGSISGGVIDDRSKGVVLVTSSNSLERQRYQDDAIYVGYTALDAASGTWTRGGVGRIMIGELGDLAPTDLQVGGSSFWKWSRVIGYPSDSTGPVTTSVVRLQDTRHNNLWLYFGTGRYYYRSFEQDDFSGRRAIYGVKEPCYKTGTTGYLDKGCFDAVNDVVCGSSSSSCLTDQTGTVGDNIAQGWRIDLDPGGGNAGAERVVADPVSMTGGAVFFPTFQPSSSPCSMGNSYLWGVRYDTGGPIPAGWLQGKVLMQLSTGELRETLPSELGGRRGTAIPGGKPGGIKIVTNSGLKPLKKIIHIQER